MLKTNTYAALQNDINQDNIDIYPQIYGAYTKHLRERARPRISQTALVKKMIELSKGIPYGRSQYSRVEADELYPSIDQVPLIYKALRELNAIISPSERHRYLLLARRKIEEKGTHHEKDNTPIKWIEIAKILEEYELNASFPIPSAVSKILPQQKRSLQESQSVQANFSDIRHVIGRDEWLHNVIELLHVSLPPKLYILQGSVGSGKSTALNTLAKNIVDKSDCQLLLVELPDSDDEITPKYLPEEYLDQFIGAVLTGLGRGITGGEKKKSLEREERIEIVFSAMTQKRTVILVDNAEAVFEIDGTISLYWEKFLSRYLRSSHLTTIVFATKEWPGWYDTQTSSYVEETLLPPLTESDGVTLLQRAGFAAVPVELLQEASRRVHHHPSALQWLAKLTKKRAYSVSWSQAPVKQSNLLSIVPKQEKQQEGKTKEEQVLRRILQERQVFGGSADSGILQPLLRRVISKRVSHEALYLLEMLAIAPTSLLHSAIETVIAPEALYNQLAELQRASLLIESEERFQLQPLAAASGYHQVSSTRRTEIEGQLLNIYRAWKDIGEFTGEQEQGQVITELAFLLLKQKHLLEASQLLVQYGWLSFGLGYGVTLARQAQNILQQSDWKSTLDNECGGLLLKVFLGRYLGEDLAATERKQAYLRLYEIIHIGNIQINPSVVQHIVHHKLRYMISQEQYSEAFNAIEEECQHYEYLRDRDPVIYAELLDRKAYVYGRWGDHLDTKAKEEPEKAHKFVEEATRLRREAASLHLHCIDLLRRYERHVSPLERSHILLKRARYLNDASYYLRCTGQLQQAQEAMEECLSIKETGSVYPNSLAVSYGDYGQLLGQLGKYREAEDYSNKAINIDRTLIDDGHDLYPDLGMQLIDKAKLLLQLGRLDEAKKLYTEGIPLVNKGTSRRDWAIAAEDGLQILDQWHNANPLHQIDWQWFPRYHELATYDDIEWLTQAGPVSSDEQKEIENLITQDGDEAAKRQLYALIAKSRQREIISCIEQQREPQFLYPLIPKSEVESLISKLLQLRLDIGHNEKNTIVRSMYLTTIDERLNELNLVNATARSDDKAFEVYSQRLAEKVTVEEMNIAVTQLVKKIHQALFKSQNSSAQEVATQVLQTLRRLGLVPKSNKYLNSFIDSSEIGESSLEQEMFSPEPVKLFFEDVFRIYEFDWTIQYASTATSARVDLDGHRLILPEKSISTGKIRDLLAHEIEVHAFRANSGSKSSLALLSSGLAGYLETEEGLAIYYTQDAIRRATGVEAKPKLWIGTIACGLASGIGCPPLTFAELHRFIELVSMLSDLLEGRNTPLEQLREKARQYAQNRCLRTFRGVTNLQQGICSHKDTYYLRGYLKVSKKIEETPPIFERLMSGSVSMNHLPELEELGITGSSVVHQHLAANPELENYIRQFKD